MNSIFTQRLSRLIALPSISSTFSQLDLSNKAVIDYLANLFTEMGLICSIHTVSESKYNLIGCLPPVQPSVDIKKGLVLSGHTDTVPTDPAQWHSDPFSLHQDDVAFYGLGVVDMKGFFAIVAEAFDVLTSQDASWQKKLVAPLYVVATSDEETSMNGARAIMNLGDLQAGVALIGEPTSLTPIRAHKGVSFEKITVVGRSGHSSDPSQGLNAIDVMQEVIVSLNEIKQQLKLTTNPLFHVPFTTLNLGCIHGGDNPNRICEQCELQFDIRPVPNMPLTDIYQLIDEKISGVAQKHHAVITHQSINQAVPSVETSINSDFVRFIEQITGKTSEAVGFGTEAPFFKAMGMDVVVLGAGSIDKAHQPNECMPKEHVAKMVAYLVKLIKAYCM